MGETSFLFSNCILVNNQLFFVDTQSGLPAVMNPENGDVIYCKQFQDYIWRAGDLIDFMGEFDGNVYALETSGDYLVVFDLQKQQCRYIPLNCNEHAWGNFVAFERYGYAFFVFPKSGDKVILFDVKNENVTELTDVLHTGEIQCACKNGNQVWLLSQNGSTIHTYNLIENKENIYKLNTDIKDCVNGILVDGSIYFLNRFGILYKWNADDESVQEIHTMETQHSNTEAMIRMVNAGNKLVVLPSFGKDIKLFDLLTGNMEIYNEYPADFSYYDIEWSRYYGYCEDENYYYFAMRLGNYFLKIRKTDGEFIWIKPNLPMSEETENLQNLYLREKTRIEFETGKHFFSEKEWKITELIKIDLRNTVNRKESLIGPKIYEEVKQ